MGSGGVFNDKVSADGNSFIISKSTVKFVVESIDLFRNAVKLSKIKVRVSPVSLLNTILNYDVEPILDHALDFRVSLSFSHVKILVACSRGGKAKS